MKTNNLIEDSAIKPDTKNLFIFKHSPRCPISSVAKSKFEYWYNIKNLEIPFQIIDVINDRVTSNQIVAKYGLAHESPQLIFIQNNEVKWVLNHFEISEINLNEKLSI
jgi:bacillithiol system protein YtxJ